MFVTICEVEGPRETWELWDGEFSHGLSPVMRNGICCHHLFCFCAYLPMCDTREGALKGDIGVSSMKVKWMLLRSPQAAVGRICMVFCLAEKKIQQDTKSVVNILQGSFPDWASIQDKYCVVWQNTVVKIKFRNSITLREYPFGGASWSKIALQLLFKIPFFIKPSKQEYVKVLATKSTFQWENNGIH